MFKSKYPLFLVLIFIISRVCFYFAGGRFDITPLDHYIQIIDPIWLKTRLWESIFYLHMQPPLFNLFLGLILKIFSQSYILVFNLIYLSLGMGLALSLFWLMLKSGVNRIIAIGITVYFIVSPAVILYENQLFYSYPVTCLLVFSVVFLYRYLEGGKLIDIIGFAGTTASLVLMRNIFHPLWFAFFVCVIVSIRRSQRRQILLVISIPALLILGVCLKNFILFKNFGTTSKMIGYDLAQMVFFETPKQEIYKLVGSGKISKISVNEVAVHVDVGRTVYQNIKIERTGVPILDEFVKPSQSAPNFNSLYHLLTTSIFLKKVKKRRLHVQIKNAP